MIVAYDAVLLVHLLGFALLVGGLLSQWGKAEPEITQAVLVGAVVQFVSGAILAGAADAIDRDAPMLMVGSKAALALVLMVLAWANRRWTSVPRGLWALMLCLAVLAAGIGVFWH